jgi:glutamyl-tRNA reductase
VRAFPQVHLYDIDDLQQQVEQGRNNRKQEVSKVEQIVEDGVRRFSDWLRARGVVPTVSDLRRYADTVREEELQRTLKRLNGLSPKDRAAIEAMAGALVKKLLHDPIGKLKGHDGERYVGALRELFSLDRDATDEA